LPSAPVCTPSSTTTLSRCDVHWNRYGWCSGASRLPIRTLPATGPRPVPDSRCAPSRAVRAQRVFLVLPALRVPPAHRGQQTCSPGPQPQRRPELLPALTPCPAPPKRQARRQIPFAGRRVLEPIHHRQRRLPRHSALRPARRRELRPSHLPVRPPEHHPRSPLWEPLSLRLWAAPVSIAPSARQSEPAGPAPQPPG